VNRRASGPARLTGSAPRATVGASSSWTRSGTRGPRSPFARAPGGARVNTVPSPLSRRAHLLAAGATGLVAAALPSRAGSQAPASLTPKRGGTLNVRAWDPPHFDHILAHAYRTHVVVSFTHSRLLRHRAGAGRASPAPSPSRAISPSRGSRSTTRPTSSSYRRGVRFHGKPPVNGRELTAEDVRYTFECILADKGSATCRCTAPSPRSRRRTNTPCASR
jgi:hypothetical protein